MTVIIETFTTPNKATKTGKPLRWRWRITDDGELAGKGRHSFKTQEKALFNAARAAVVPDGTILRRPGHNDVPWSALPIVQS